LTLIIATIASPVSRVFNVVICWASLKTGTSKEIIATLTRTACISGEITGLARRGALLAYLISIVLVVAEITLSHTSKIEEVFVLNCPRASYTDKRASIASLATWITDRA
jgi:hypothetical protein